MRITACFIFMLFVVGCTTPKHSWPDKDRSLVWTAMIAAAETQEYDSKDPRKRWIVVENYVDADPEQSQIQIHRILARSLKLPRQKEQHDRRDWFFVVKLLPFESSRPNLPPTATFRAQNTQLIPAQVHDEAERYFSTVDALLEKLPQN